MSDAFVQVHEDPDVFMVRIQDVNFPDNFTNCYVVRSAGEFLAVDCGMDTKRGPGIWEEAFSRLGARPERTRFFLTHGHVDHADLLETIAPAGSVVYAGAGEFRTAASLRDGSGVRAVVRRFRSEGMAALDDPAEYASMHLGCTPFDASRYDVRTVDEGDEIAVGDVRFAVLDTSGHSAGHRSLYHAESGLLVSGDQVLWGTNPFVPLYGGVSDRLGRYVERLRSVRNLRPALVLPGHGDPRTEGFAARADELAEHRLARAASVRDYMAAHPGTTGMEVATRLFWEGPAGKWRRLKVALRWCIVTNALSAIDHELAEGRVRWEADESGVRRYFAEA